MNDQQHIRRIYKGHFVATYPSFTGGTRKRPEQPVVYVWVQDTPQGSEGGDKVTGETQDSESDGKQNEPSKR